MTDKHIESTEPEKEVEKLEQMMEYAELMQDQFMSDWSERDYV